VLAVAALLRIVVMLGYPPAMFFNDSYNYMTDAVTAVPDGVRSSGYPLFLRVLEPLHSLNVVTGLQALMGLAMGTAIYALLRRRGLPWWGATLCALPVLFDVFELQLEHMVASDVLFYTLLTAAVVLLCWWDRPPVAVAALVGLLVGYAATVRNVGEIMLVFIVIGMLARRMGWRRIAATVIVGVVPIVGYMVWFHASYGKYAMNEATGTFLYSRVQSFADCAKMGPPANLRVLCDDRPPSHRPNSQEYLWSNQTPLGRLTGPDNTRRFTPQIESLTMKFAKLAIEKQPLDYARVVARDVLTTFGPTRANANNDIGNLEGSGSKFQFERTVWPVPGWVTDNTANREAARDFGGADYGEPSVVQPWARFLWLYQHVYLRGPLLFVYVLTGFVGIVLSARRKARFGWGGLGLLPWLTAVALIVLPPMTSGFSYRYALAAVPTACLAAGLAFAGRGNLVSWLRARIPNGS
jgi:type III secretory pathway component EscS